MHRLSPKLVTKPRILNYQPPVFKPLTSITLKLEEKPPSPTTPREPYKVLEGDSLTSIAAAHQTSVERLWRANTQLADPDTIQPAQSITIPLDSDTLPERDMISGTTSRSVSQGSPPISGGFSSSGNFVFGWCTFYADQQRPDIHATGNAADWIRYSNSSEPRVGAVAVNTWAAGGLGHVGIVVDFNATQVLVRSMNFHKFRDVTTDWVDKSYWAGYIL